MTAPTDRMAALTGFNVITSNLLPLDPSPGEDARRIVRHGMADVLAWLGEKVGPKPGEQTHLLIFGKDIHASAVVVGRLLEATR